MPHSDQHITTVFGRTDYDIGSGIQLATRLFQIFRGHHRAIGAYYQRKATVDKRVLQCVRHPLSKVCTLLRDDFDSLLCCKGFQDRVSLVLRDMKFYRGNRSFCYR